jgi:alpha-beta hydrolase superfamily lysophospholipase/SAM-dependent methyltransferase
MTTTTDTAHDPWIRSESGFETFDQTRLFYRCWQPRDTYRTAASPPLRVLVFLHRGHEHSGRIEPLVEQFAGLRDWAFAWDARGHGHSPGERGAAPDFESLVQDFHWFIRHLRQVHGFAPEDMVVIANSVGAVIAATWIHDHAPHIRGVVMAAAAFQIKLYVPLAKPALRLALGFKPDLAVTSYIRPSMLTHSPEQAHAYAADPLIAKRISARVLLGLADTAERIVADAFAIDVPVLMLVAEKDYVVHAAPQQLFFERLGSRHKRLLVLKDCFHAVFYEQGPPMDEAIQATRQFIDGCFGHPIAAVEEHLDGDRNSRSAAQFGHLQRGTLGTALERAANTVQRQMLQWLGPLSNGMQIGLTQGFDSGASLDYVYRNEAGGRFGIGKFIDQGYLQAIGWRGIRLRKQHLQQVLSELIATHPANLPLRILDVAAGGGRYVLETAKRFQDRPMHITLRDYAQANLDAARQLAEALALNHTVEYECRDAFSPDSYPIDESQFDIVIVSGLYELFAENAPVLASLQGIQRQLRPGGHLVYTGQPWHPQLLMIAQTLNNHCGEPWLMRPRPQAELDALVASIDCRKTQSLIGLAGIFTVSVARHEPPPAKPVAAG